MHSKICGDDVAVTLSFVNCEIGSEIVFPEFAGAFCHKVKFTAFGQFRRNDGKAHTCLEGGGFDGLQIRERKEVRAFALGIKRCQHPVADSVEGLGTVGGFKPDIYGDTAHIFPVFGVNADVVDGMEFFAEVICADVKFVAVPGDAVGIGGTLQDRLMRIKAA